MSKFVYTTAISKETIKAYEHYQRRLEAHRLNETKENHVKVLAAYIGFAEACENENKSPLQVIDVLNS